MAWEALRRRETDFETYRAQAFLDSGGYTSIQRAKAAYMVFNTHACQLGLALTLGSLWELRKRQSGGADLSTLPAFADALVKGWNAYFAQGHGSKRDRRLAFIKNDGVITNPLNQIANMDTPQAVYFRYFWMQALATPVAWQEISPWFSNESRFNALLSAARELYLSLCEDQQFKALKLGNPGTGESKLRKDARQRASNSIKRALRDWFYVSENSYDLWFAGLGQSSSPLKSPDAVSDSANEEIIDDESEEDSPVASVRDLLGD